MAEINEVQLRATADVSGATGPLDDLTARLAAMKKDLDGIQASSSKAASETASAATSAGSSMGSMFGTIAKAAGAAVAGVTAVAGVVGAVMAPAIRDAVALIDELNRSAISMAAAAVTADKSLSFTEGLKNAKAIQAEIQKISGGFSGTERELIKIADAMVQWGMGLDLTNDKAKENFLTFANTLKALTKGQSLTFQANQEIRALMMGQVRASSSLVMALERAGVNVREMVPKWVEQGTVLENIVKALPGYAASVKEITNSVEAQKNKTESILNTIKREGLKQAYDDILGIQKSINEYLFQGNELTKEGKQLMEALKTAYEFLRALVVGLGTLVKELLIDPLVWMAKKIEESARQMLAAKQINLGETGFDISHWDDPAEVAKRAKVYADTFKQERPFDSRVFPSPTEPGKPVLPPGKMGGEDSDAMTPKELERAHAKAIRELERAREKRIRDQEHLEATIRRMRKRVEKEEQDDREKQVKNLMAHNAEMLRAYREYQADVLELERTVRDMKPPDVFEPDRLRAIREETTRLNDYMDDMKAKFDQQLSFGIITPEEYAERMERIKAIAREGYEAIAEFHSIAYRGMQAGADTFYSGMEHAWGSFFEKLSTGLLRFKDLWKDFLDVLRMAWVNALTRMVSDWMQTMMSNVFMSAIKGAGSMFGFGSAFGMGNQGSTGIVPGVTVAAAEGAVFPGRFQPIAAFQHGGIVNRPTLGLIGEGGGPEAVVPLKGGNVPVKFTGKGEGMKDVNVNFNITTVDALGLDRVLMERRSLIAGIIRSELSNAGYLRDTIRRYA